MLWPAVDVLLALVSLGVLALVVLRLWRSVKALSRTAADAGEAVGAASDRLAAAQAEGPRRQ